MTDMPARGTPLSRREHEVICLMAGGLDYIQVGAALDISASTVAAHCARAMARSKTSSLFQLGMWANQNGYGTGRDPVFSEDRCNCNSEHCQGLDCRP